MRDGVGTSEEQQHLISSDALSTTAMHATRAAQRYGYVTQYYSTVGMHMISTDFTLSDGSLIPHVIYVSNTTALHATRAALRYGARWVLYLLNYRRHYCLDVSPGCDSTSRSTATGDGKHVYDSVRPHGLYLLLLLFVAVCRC